MDPRHAEALPAPRPADISAGAVPADAALDPRFARLLTSSLPLLRGRSPAPDTRLRDVGVDSMQAVEMLFAIEETFGVLLPDEELNDTTFATAGSLWNVVRAALDGLQGGSDRA